MMSTTTIRLPENLKERVAKVAEKAGKSAHALIIDAIAQRVDEEECRNELYNTAEQRFAEIATSGETIAWEDMRAYLQDRVAGKEADRPVSRKIAP